MKTKICSYCHEEKNIEEFRKSGNRYRGECKKCEAKKHKEYCKTHKDIIKKIRRRTYLKNISKYHEQNIKNREKKTKYNKEYYAKNIDYFKARAKKYNLEHRKQLMQKGKQWKENNKDKVKEYQKKDYLKRRKDPVLKLKDTLRNMMKNSFKRKGMVKSKKLEEICGCSIDILIEHLIKTYETNYNTKWDWKFIQEVHIDHKIPLATAKTEEDVIKLCHYTNLQLLKAQDNLKKGRKIFDM